MAFKNGVTQRYYFCINIRLESPLCVSSGENEYTDRDLERDFNGNPFVPGASLAGALRNYILYTEETSCTDRLFGYTDMQKGYQSRFSFSDLTFENNHTISVRNQTKLEQKVAVTGSKFDLENIEKGAEGTFYIEIEFRENDDNDLKTSAFRFLKKMIYGIDSGEIAFGSSKSSGFGNFSIKKIYGCGFGILKQEGAAKDSSESLQEYFIRKGRYSDFSRWLEFDKWGMQKSENELDFMELYPDKKISLYTTLTVPLKLSGTLNIRQYITKYEKEDNSTHIFRTARDEGGEKKRIPIIPGSSWKGALRSQCERILQELGIWKEELVFQMFGFIEKNRTSHGGIADIDMDRAAISSVIIEESDIDGGRMGHFQSVTRNKISRFTGGTVNHALLQEEICVYGKCSLTIHIRKDMDADGKDKNAWMTGLLLLAFKDLQNGYVAVGGETGIGRGIFEPDGDIMLSDGGNTAVSGILMNQYLEKLAEKKERRNVRC